MYNQMYVLKWDLKVKKSANNLIILINLIYVITVRE